MPAHYLFATAKSRTQEMEHRMSTRFQLAWLVTASAVCLGTPAIAQDTVKIGELNSYKGPPAALDLHAGRDADARRHRSEEEALGRGLSEFRVWPVGCDLVQGDAEKGAARCRVRDRASPAARQGRCRRRRASDRRRQARRHF